MDNLVTDNNHLDGRPEFSPSHWDENFKIYYLTEKMRSQKDPQFSDLCDRVGRGKQTEADEKYLISRIQTNEAENCNENFKIGKILIIVTVNDKRDLVNHKKLAELLPDEQEFLCNSTDMVTNVPAGNTLPDKLKGNPGKTGNLQSELRLKVGAPVVMTTNHQNRIYKEDGLMNGARGYVQAIQVSKQNPKKVEVVWIVFHDENIGKLYRVKHNHLRKDFDPGHKLATPILPTRSKFRLKFGDVEYQRQNFALSLAYSLTAHKCQGETLEEVIIDFGPDTEHKIKNYICTGSFYVALTRVREGKSVYLRSYDKSYIKVNQKIEEKVKAMINHKSYQFKKIYLDQKIFELENQEIKVGYLNINGLLDGHHEHYFNADINLNNLDIIVLAETKLGPKIGNEYLQTSLSNWRIIARYDSEDQRKHMGLLLLTSKASNFNGSLSITYQTVKRDGKIQIEGLIVKGMKNLTLGFLYCRSTPTDPEIKAINKYFVECNILMGDINLSHRIKRDREKLENLCNARKVSALKEITRSISNNQLDYILMDKILLDKSFATSFHNFISDHKAITARIGIDGNSLTDEIKMKLTFDSESHLKVKSVDESYDGSTSSSNESGSDYTKPLVATGNYKKNFRRKFMNVDYSTCWLNSCLQLMLTALDQCESPTLLNSELGEELMRLRNSDQDISLDPTTAKNIIVAAEDTRIAIRISEIEKEVNDEAQRQRQIENVRRLRHDLLHGQQCIRDLFLCLQENSISWPDICSVFNFRITYSSTCCGCGNKIESEIVHMYVEIDVPPQNSSLSESLEDYFCTSNLNARLCNAKCKIICQYEKRVQISLVRETEFFITILSRAIETLNGYQLNENQIISTNDVYIRYEMNFLKM